MFFFEFVRTFPIIYHIFDIVLYYTITLSHYTTIVFFSSRKERPVGVRKEHLLGVRNKKRDPSTKAAALVAPPLAITTMFIASMHPENALSEHLEDLLYYMHIYHVIYDIYDIYYILYIIY